MNMMEVTDTLPDRLLDRMFDPAEQWWKMEMPNDAMSPTIKRGDVLFVKPCYRYEGEGFYVLRNVHRDPKLGGDTVCRVGHGPWLLFDNPVCAASMSRRLERREFDDVVIGRVAWVANRP